MLHFTLHTFRAIWGDLEKERAKQFENIVKIIKEEDRLAKIKKDKEKKDKERQKEELIKKREEYKLGQTK